MIIAVCVLACTAAFAQKKPLDHSVYDGWQSTSAMTLTDDGGILTYLVSPQQGDAELVVVNTATGRELRVERGGAASVSRDGRWAVFTIKAPYAATRQAKIDKKKADEMPKDSLGIIDLSTFELRKIANVSASKTSLERRNVVAYQTEWKKEVPDTVKPAPKAEKITVVLDLASGRTDTLKNVDKYAFDRYGDRLAVVFKRDKKDSLTKDEVALYKLPDMGRKTLSEGKRFYSLPNFNDPGDKLVFLASTDTNATGNKHCSVVLYEELMQGKGKKAKLVENVEELIPQDYALEGGLCVTENGSPAFSKNSSRVLLGVAECMPPKDTTIVDFETAQLDIWSYDIYMTPPIQKARAAQLRTATYESVINLGADRHRIIRLNHEITATTSYFNGAEGQWALVRDNKPYQISSTWDSNSFQDVYLVDMNTGESKCLFKKLNGTANVSPGGKYIYWFSDDDLGWHTYRMADGVSLNVTDAAGVPFFDEEDDHPAPPPSVDRPHWMDGDEAFLLSDKYDIWKVQPDGKYIVNMTEGEGRSNNWQLSYANYERNDIPAALTRLGVLKTIGKKDEVFLTVFDRTTKENGIATFNADKPGLKSSFTDKYTFSNVTKAKDADLFVYRKGNFNNSPDVYTTSDRWANERKWSAINPQQADYNWGNNRLVHWKAYDGTPLDGMLITPEDLDPTKKYPMMIYFYEKNSENVYSYYSPAPRP